MSSSKLQIFLIGLIVSFGFDSVSGTIHKTCSGEELTLAIASVRPGDIIELPALSDPCVAGGSYIYGEFSITINGTKDNPITLRSPHEFNSSVRLSSLRGTVLTLKADYWIISNICFSSGENLITIQNGNQNILQNLKIEFFWEQGIQILGSSTGNQIQSSEFLGSRNGNYIRIGSNETTSTQSTPTDLTCRRNIIQNNKFINEFALIAIEINPWSCGLIQNNVFDGTNKFAPDFQSWIHLKGDSFVIINNRGNGATENGFIVSNAITNLSDPAYPSGKNNVFSSNNCTLRNPQGYCIFVRDEEGILGDKVCVNPDNIFSGAKGLTNIPLCGLSTTTTTTTTTTTLAPTSTPDPIEQCETGKPNTTTTTEYHLSTSCPGMMEYTTITTTIILIPIG